MKTIYNAQVLHKIMVGSKGVVMFTVGDTAYYWTTKAINTYKKLEIDKIYKIKANILNNNIFKNLRVICEQKDLKPDAYNILFNNNDKNLTNV